MCVNVSLTPHCDIVHGFDLKVHCVCVCVYACACVCVCEPLFWFYGSILLLLSILQLDICCELLMVFDGGYFMMMMLLRLVAVWASFTFAPPPHPGG